MAEVDDVGEAEVPALHAAAAANDIATAVELLEAGANTEEHDDAGRTPIVVAAEAGAFEVARVLIDRGADVDAVDGAGRSALYAAVEHYDGQGALIELLRFAGASAHRASFDGTTPVTLARRDIDSDVARFFADIRVAPALSFQEIDIEAEAPATEKKSRKRGFGRRERR